MFKSIQVGGGVSKSPNLSFRTLWMVFLVLTHVRQVCVRDHVRRFYDNCQALHFQQKLNFIYIFWWRFNPFTPSSPLGRSQYSTKLKQQHLGKGKSKWYFQWYFFWRVFNNLNNDNQVARLYTCGSLVTNV